MTTSDDRLRLTLPGISVPQMRGDNLAIALCSYFENPDQEVDDDTGWTPDAISGHDATLDAIHAHYASELSAMTARALAAEAALEAMRKEPTAEEVEASKTVAQERIGEVGTVAHAAWFFDKYRYQIDEIIRSVLTAFLAARGE